MHQGVQTTAQIEGPDEASAAKAAWLLEGIAARHIFFESLDIAGSRPPPAGQHNENVSLGSWRKMTISTPIDDWFHVSMQQRAERARKKLELLVSMLQEASCHQT